MPALVKEVLSPLVIGAAHQAHDVAAGVEIERARFAREFHPRFHWGLVALAAIAGMAAGNEVLPGGEAATRPRDDVV